MAKLISVANGNWTSASTWKKVAAAGLLETQGSSTALTTGNLDSATFVLGATAVDAMAVKLASRAAGSPSNTITITLRNSTGATNVAAITLNVSDLPACTTTDIAGGWIVIPLGLTHTPNGTDSYLVRATLNSTSTAVSLWTNGTANNWARLIRETTTQAPVAGDDLIIAGEHTGAGTGTNYSVVMDSTANTDYGTAVVSGFTDAVAVCKRGTLTCGQTASTNYILRVSGVVNVYSGGTVTLAPVPTSTCVVELDCPASNGQSTFASRTGATCTFTGSPRTAGKAVSQTLLTASMSAAATTATVADDTGWLNGDEVAIAPTSRTATAYDSLTLNANATSSGLAFSAGATNAHLGLTTDKAQAEVLLITRNVLFRSTSSSFMAQMLVANGATANFTWTDFRYCGYGLGTTTPGIDIQTATSGSCTMSHCIVRNTASSAIKIGGALSGGTVSLTQVHVFLGAATLNSLLIAVTGTITSGLTIAQCTVVCGVASFPNGFSFATTVSAGSIADIRAAGCSVGIIISGDISGATCTGTWASHSNSGFGVSVASSEKYLSLPALEVWRNTGIGFAMSGLHFAPTIASLLAFGNSGQNVSLADSSGSYVIGLRIGSLRSYGDTGFPVSSGVGFNTTGNPAVITGHIDSAEFGVSNGSLYTTHLSNDVALTPVANVIVLDIGSVRFASSTEVSNMTSQARGSVIACQKTSGAHKVHTPVGTLTLDTTTVDVTPSLKLTPSSASFKLDTAAVQVGRGFLVGVLSGQTVTVSVKVQKDGSYNGNAARLLQKMNYGVGVTADVVLATHSAGSGTFQTLSGTSAAATADGVMEFVVDCDGTAGNIFVDTWSAV